MAVCKCFINDQLLPVRAGCEAIYCKDVNSDTAIRNEALSRITSLRAQVARLEGELAEARRLEHISWRMVELSLHWEERGKDIEAAFRGQAEAEAANAALVAALENVPVEPANIPWLRWEPGAIKRFWKWYNVTRRAALSPDAGKGWLPPEWWKGKMFRHIPGVLSGACDPSCGACALDALKGVEADEAG